MKCFFGLLLCSFIFSATHGQNKISTKLIGTWQATDTENATGVLEFLDSASVIVTISGQTMPKARYVIDSTKTPMWFDIVVKKQTGFATLKGLLQFMDENTLKWQVFFDGNRPNSFARETDDNTIVLKKKL